MGVVTRSQKGKLPPTIKRLIDEIAPPPTRTRPKPRTTPSRVTKRKPKKAAPKKSTPAKRKTKKPAPKKPAPKKPATKKPAPNKNPTPEEAPARKPDTNVHQHRGSPSSRVTRSFVPESQRSSLSSVGSREHGYRAPQQARSTTDSSSGSRRRVEHTSPSVFVKAESATPSPSKASHISREPAADRDDRNRSRQSRNFDDDDEDSDPEEEEEEGEIVSSTSPTGSAAGAQLRFELQETIERDPSARPGTDGSTRSRSRSNKSK